MRAALATLALFTLNGVALAEDVPLPHPRPATINDRFAVPPSGTVIPSITALAPAPELQGGVPLMPEASPDPSPCALRLAEIASFNALPALIGPGACGARDAVELSAIVMPDKSRVAIVPPAVMRCTMAEAVTHWMREDVGPAVAPYGGSLTAINNFDSFECRGRNRIVGAKLSEHGKANALDIHGLKLSNGKTIDPTSAVVSKDLRTSLRASACARFMTVLGPGSDGYHENHIHVDLAERRNNYKLCHWELREPPMLVNVPLPVPRPVAATENEPK